MTQVALLHMDGADGGTTFTDVNGHTFTAAGTCVTTTGNKKFGTASLLNQNIGNVSDGISTPDATDFRFGGIAWTWEGWIYKKSDMSQYRTIAGKRHETLVDWEIGLVVTTGELYFYNGTLTNSGVVPTDDVWSFVAVSHDGTTLQVYLDGTRIINTSTNVAVTDNATQLNIGNWPFTGFKQPFNDGIDEVRIHKGVALYSGATISVPTDAFPDAPTADFSGTPTSGTTPLSVVFTDSSNMWPTQTSWLWEKNDGSGWVSFVSGSTTQNPTESFTAGTWSVRLTATNTAGSVIEIKTDYVSVTAQTKTGPGGIDPTRRIYKPTGLPLKPPKEGRKSTQDRVDESGQIQAEIASRLSKEFTEELNQEREAASIALMTQAQIDAEIAFLMKEKMQKMQKEDEEIIQLIVAIAAKDL